MLYQSKINAQFGNLEQLREAKKRLMEEREVLLDRREKHMAVSHD
jgi:hypothetical protein